MLIGVQEKKMQVMQLATDGDRGEANSAEEKFCFNGKRSNARVETRAEMLACNSLHW